MFNIWGLGFRVPGSEVRVKYLGFAVKGSCWGFGRVGLLGGMACVVA